ncbi:MAG: DUF805 domain-containing protein [Crocinitomix sp.]|nr:DUF805 domain-containing protein [Crocinitomix sp.]
MKEFLIKHTHLLKMYNLHSMRSYNNFKGRASREELIYAAVSYILIVIIANLISNSIFKNDSIKDFILFPFFLITIIPILSLSFRRLHDTDRRGWIVLIPIAFFIITTVVGGVYGSHSAIFGLTAVILSFSLVWIIIHLVKRGDAGKNEHEDSKIYSFSE